MNEIRALVKTIFNNTHTKKKTFSNYWKTKFALNNAAFFRFPFGTDSRIGAGSYADYESNDKTEFSKMRILNFDILLEKFSRKKHYSQSKTIRVRRLGKASSNPHRLGKSRPAQHKQTENASSQCISR